MEASTKIHAPSEKEVEKLMRQIEHISLALSKFAVTLTPHERRSILKQRPGGEKIAELVKRVASARKIAVTGASAADIDANLARASRLTPLRAATQMLAKLLDDTILQAQSKTWWATTAIYTTLRGAARSDGQLKKELEPATAFFATGRRKPKAPPPAAK